MTYDVEPGDEGGEAPCFAHLLEDEPTDDAAEDVAPASGEPRA